jgi:hypothetical protein
MRSEFIESVQEMVQEIRKLSGEYNMVLYSPLAIYEKVQRELDKDPISGLILRIDDVLDVEIVEGTMRGDLWIRPEDKEDKHNLIVPVVELIA